METKINSFRDLIVWQKAKELAIRVYKITETFPRAELFGLTNQMRRAAVSIAANIAEGNKRSTRKDYKHFLHNALGSGAELESHLEIAEGIGLINTEESK